MINYQITPQINSHTYLITLQFTSTKTKHILKLPSWIPGSYMIREFSKNIVNIAAIQGSKTIECTQTEKNTWVLPKLKIGGVVNITYTVYAYEFGIRTAFLDFNRGYFNSTSLCIYVEGKEDSVHTITLNHLPKGWQIATGLTKISANQYRAKDYDELIDCPVELGKFTRWEFKVKDVTHYFILSGTVCPNIDKKRFLSDVSKICKTEIDLFGGIAPFESYTFILYLGTEIYTGLEHRNSTLLMAPYYSMPMTNQVGISDAYLKLLGLISHEFFHTWNVKRLKPQVFSPYNLNSENYTKLLWWFEGITSYYDDLILRRAGLIDNKQYLTLITENINSVYKYNGTKEQTLANGSLVAWIKYYRQDENSPNSLVSYYVKGSLVGLCLDLLIRDATKSKKSLDDVMIGLYKKWQVDGLGIMEDEIPKLIKQYTGCGLSNEIQKFVETCDELPLGDLLAKFGVIIHKLKNRCHDEIGSVIDKISDLPTSVKFDLGCKLTKESLGYKINYIYTGSIAESVGLAANDVIIAIDNIKLTDFAKQIDLYKKGSKIILTIFRQEQLINVSLKLQQSGFDISYLRVADDKKLANWL